MSTLVVPIAPRRLSDLVGSHGVGENAAHVRSRLIEAFCHMEQPVSRQSPAGIFGELATTWKAETLFESSASVLTSHPAYLRIVAMGWPAVPLLLQSLEVEPDHWFVALSAITGADPVPLKERGDVGAMARAWLRWGSERGYHS